MWPFGGVGASFSGPFTRNLGLASRAPNKVVGPSVRRNTAPPSTTSDVFVPAFKFETPVSVFLSI